MELGELGFAFARRPAEQLVELAAGHAEAAMELEIAQVEPVSAIGLDINQMVFDLIDVLGLAIGGQAHQFVFAGIDLETAVVGEGRIQQPKGMGEVDFPQRLEAAALTKPGRSGGPFTNPIHAKHSG